MERSAAKAIAPHLTELKGSEGGREGADRPEQVRRPADAVTQGFAACGSTGENRNDVGGFLSARADPAERPVESRPTLPFFVAPCSPGTRSIFLYLFN